MPLTLHAPISPRFHLAILNHRVCGSLMTRSLTTVCKLLIRNNSKLRRQMQSHKDTDSTSRYTVINHYPVSAGISQVIITNKLELVYTAIAKGRNVKVKLSPKVGDTPYLSATTRRTDGCGCRFSGCAVGYIDRLLIRLTENDLRRSPSRSRHPMETQHGATYRRMTRSLTNRTEPKVYVSTSGDILDQLIMWIIWIHYLNSEYSPPSSINNHLVVISSSRQ